MPKKLIRISTALKRSCMQFGASVATLTFGDCAENHVGMEQLGTRANKGFTHADLLAAQARFEAVGRTCRLVHLGEDAYVLVIEKGVDQLVGSALALFHEQALLNYDRLALMRNRVVNKRARYNLCFDDEGHEPAYELGKGRVIAYRDVPLSQMLQAALPTWFGLKAEGLKGEGNYYYDLATCGIGYHGDSERRKVIAARVGASMPIYFQWFERSMPIGERIEIPLDHGDMYIMSEQAVGTNWKCSSIRTLRHATGCDAYTVI
jgi:hypothetical protein